MEFSPLSVYFVYSSHKYLSESFLRHLYEPLTQRRHEGCSSVKGQVFQRTLRN